MGVLSLQAYLETHPNSSSPLRYPENQAWSATRFFTFGLLGIILLLISISSKLRHLLLLAPIFWLGYLLWLFLVWFPLALFTGVPLQN